MTTVVNIRDNKTQYDVYIGRPSIWGNPFVIGRDGTREEVRPIEQTIFVKRQKTWMLL